MEMKDWPKQSKNSIVIHGIVKAIKNKKLTINSYGTKKWYNYSFTIEPIPYDNVEGYSLIIYKKDDFIGKLKIMKGQYEKEFEYFIHGQMSASEKQARMDILKYK